MLHLLFQTNLNPNVLALKTLVLNQRVEIDTVATDAYGRKIARIRRGALQVNMELVRQGNAWALSRYRRNADLLLLILLGALAGM